MPGGWRIEGLKWFITGAAGAAFAICMARTSGEPGQAGGRDDVPGRRRHPGMQMVRHIDTLDEGLYGGHFELLFDNCVVPDQAVLGEVDHL